MGRESGEINTLHGFYYRRGALNFWEFEFLKGGVSMAALYF
jgi:hypothetical protein